MESQAKRPKSKLLVVLAAVAGGVLLACVLCVVLVELVPSATPTPAPLASSPDSGAATFEALVIASVTALVHTPTILPTATLEPPTLTGTPPTLTHTPKPSATPTIPTATRTPKPTPTTVPSKTPIPAVAIEDIYRNYKEMTSLQFQDYTASIAGKPVRQRVTVGNVDKDGAVSLSGPWSPIIINWSNFCVALKGMPRADALKLSGGDSIYIEATINGIVGNNQYYLNCENTLLLAYKTMGQ
jgi:hypothetical protein